MGTSADVTAIVWNMATELEPKPNAKGSPGVKFKPNMRDLRSLRSEGRREEGNHQMNEWEQVASNIRAAEWPNVYVQVV
jgi:hypothetical protein